MAWLVKRSNFDGVLFDTELSFIRPTISKTCKTEMVPLYAAPPAPSVAVKELQWDDDGGNLKARMGDREWMLNITSDGKTWAGSTRPFVFGRNLTWSSVPNCSMVSLEAAKAACQADCQARYAALSAQVEDVSEMPQSPWPASDWAIGRIKELEAQAIPEGWQLVPKEPTDEMHNAARDWAVKKYGLGIGRDGSDGCYRAMLAAAPAKQAG